MIQVIAETAATVNVFEMLRVVWMEVAMASFAATVYFTFSGYFTTKKKAKAVRAPNSPRNQDHNTVQLATKAIRQGNIKNAVALVQQLSEAASGWLPTNVAPRLLMAVAKSQNFDEAVAEMNVFASKIEGRSFDAAVSEAVRNKDAAACRQLEAMSHLLSISNSQQALETLAKMQGADADTKEAAAHSKEIRTCGKNGDLAGALKIFEQHRENSGNALMYNSIMDACVECGDLSKAVEYFDLAKSSGCADVVTHNTAMKAYLKQGKVEVAEKLFTELSKSIASYHIMLNFRACSGDRASLWKLVDDMQAAGILPTTTTCAIMLKGKPTSADINKILSLADKLDSVDEVFFHSLAEACIHTGDLQLLSKYQEKLASQSSTSALSAPTYGSMIKAYGQARDVRRVEELWKDMVKHGVQPTAITLGCMIEALVANRRTTPAWELVQQMNKEESTRPLVNNVIYSTILKGFAYAKETNKVMSLYEDMKAKCIQPNNITYNTILNAFAQAGAMDRVPALLEDMNAAIPPAEPDLVTYSTIVKGYCNAGSLDRALQLVEKMRSDSKLVPDEMMYNSLLDGCAKEQRPAEALKLLEDMKKTGVAPSNFTLSMLVKLMGRNRRLNQAFSMVEDLSKEYGLKVNIQVYTCLIQACFNNRQAGKAVALHDQIIAEGVMPDEFVYSVLVKGALQSGLVEKAVYLTKCAYGVGVAQFTGAPPGIKSNHLDDLVYALGGPKGVNAMKLLDEIAKAQVANAPRCQGKGSSKGRASTPPTPPWRRN